MTEPDRTSPSRQGQSSARVAATAGRLRIDAATAEILRAFDGAGLRAVLLKGPALADWYVEDTTRSYVDCDLWVAPACVEAAGAVLAGLGFRRVLDDRGLPDWWQEHGSDWWRHLDGVAVDLHSRLQGLGVDEETAWQSLSATAETITVAGHPAPVLSIPGRALYVTLHAAHHGMGWGKALAHVQRALKEVDEAAWRDAASLADRLRGTDAFATGLRLLPEGAELAARLSLPDTQSVEVALRAGTPPPIALGLEQLARAAGWRERLEIIARKAIPPPGFIRHWWAPASRNRRMLVLGYLYRPVWLLRHGPKGLRSWLVARRSVRPARSTSQAAGGRKRNVP